MPRNTVGVKKPYTNTEFNEIVARGEHRLGIHNFIGYAESVLKTEKPSVPVEKLIEAFDGSLGEEYTEVFAKAVVSIKHISDYRGSR